MARISKPWRAMALAGVLVLAACEPDVVGATSVTGDADAATDALTSAGGVDDTTVTTVVSRGLESLVVMEGSASDDGVLGAGCATGDEDALPDGMWFGFVLDASKHRLVVDVACVYGPGTDQFEVYSATDDVRWPSYVVVNDVVEERELRFGANAQAYMAVDNWQPRAIREAIEQSRAEDQPGPRGVWMRVEDGRISAVVQPYTIGVAAG